MLNTFFAASILLSGVSSFLAISLHLLFFRAAISACLVGLSVCLSHIRSISIIVFFFPSTYGLLKPGISVGLMFSASAMACKSQSSVTRLAISSNLSGISETKTTLKFVGPMSILTYFLPLFSCYLALVTHTAKTIKSIIIHTQYFICTNYSLLC